MKRRILLWELKSFKVHQQKNFNCVEKFFPNFFFFFFLLLLKFWFSSKLQVLKKRAWNSMNWNVWSNFLKVPMQTQCNANIKKKIVAVIFLTQQQLTQIQRMAVGWCFKCKHHRKLPKMPFIDSHSRVCFYCSQVALLKYNNRGKWTCSASSKLLSCWQTSLPLQTYWKALRLNTVFNVIFISLSILGSVKNSTSFIEEIENWLHKGKKGCR